MSDTACTYWLLSRQPVEADALHHALRQHDANLVAFTELHSPHVAVFARLILDAPLSRYTLVTVSDEMQVDLLAEHRLPRLDTPGLLLMDMDSTAIQIECIDELAALAGIGDRVAQITEQAMRGELDFQQSLRARVGLLEGQPSSIIDQVADNLPLTPGIAALCKVLKARGWHLAVVSGGFVPMVRQLQQMLGLDAVYANTLAIEQEKLTGQVIGDIVDGERKAQLLAELSQRYGLDASQVVAMGDGANDLKMLAAAGLGIAFEAKPKVRAAADWSLTHNSPDAVLAVLEADL